MDNQSTTILEAIKSVQYPWIRIITELLPTTVFFYIVLATSKQRFMKAFAGVIVVETLMGVTSGIYTAIVMVSHLLEVNGQANEAILIGLTIECAKDVMFAYMVISPLLSGIGLYLAWRKIKRFQI